MPLHPIDSGFIKATIGAGIQPVTTGFSRSSAVAGGGFTGLLDTYPNAAFAYSFRKLRAAYGGSAVRIRESGGNTEQNFGFDGSGNFDSAGAATFIGANSGFIVTWYDQSGNGLDVTQSTTGDQPFYEPSLGPGALPTMLFASADKLSKTSVSLSSYISTQGTIFAVMRQAGSVANHTLFNWAATANTNILNCHPTFSDVIYFDLGTNGGAGRVSVAQPTGWDDNDHLLELYRDSGDNQAIVVDGVSLVSASRTDDIAAGSATFVLGSDGAGDDLCAYVSELVCWGTDLG